MQRGKTKISRFDEGTEYFFDEGCFILESWNREEDPGVSIVRARVPAGGITRYHSLDDTRERYVILDGRGEVEIGNEPPEAVGPGDVVYIPPGCRQRIRNTGPADLVFLAVCSPRFESDCYRDEDD